MSFKQLLNRMITDNVKITLRTLARHQFATFVKTTCLALGLASIIVIGAYVHSEVSYDKFFKDHRDIYRVTIQYLHEGRAVQSAKNYSPLASIIRENAASVSAVSRMFPTTMFVSNNERQLKSKEDRFCFADSTVFSIFSFKSLDGKLQTALNAPFSIVLTESSALRLFGRSDNLIGRELQIQDDRTVHRFNVTAIIEDVPLQSHLTFDFLASFSSLPSYDNWHHPPMYIYIKGSGDANAVFLQDQIETVAKKFQPDYVNEEKRAYILQNIADIHLLSNNQDEWKLNSNISYIKIFVGIALIILMLACLNYINLTNATASQRLKEVGVKKIVGARKGQIVMQFMGESLVFTLLSTVCALLLADLSLKFLFPLVNLTEMSLSLDYLFDWRYSVGLISLALLVSLLCGFYPSVFISKFTPISALKGVTAGGFRISSVTKAMVLFQFFISSMMIIGTFVVYKQINYMNRKELGFVDDQIVSLHMPDVHSSGNYETLKRTLLNESSVVSSAISSAIPGAGDFYTFPAKPEGFSSENEIAFSSLGVDEDFMKTYGLRILSGRGFSNDIVTDETEAFILNEAAVELLNWKDPIGKTFELTVYTTNDEVRKGRVIGVVKDFHFKSLYNRIEPVVIYINKHLHYTDYLSVRLKPGNIQDAREMLQHHWNEFNPDKPMELMFLNENLDRLYRAENSRGELLIVFTILSLVISCLGLFALSSHYAERKIKEIGIRKVLGATVASIIKLLSKDHFALVFMANLISWPFAWYVCNVWLNSFAYRVKVGFDLLLLSLISILIICMLTIILQCYRVAVNNPVKSLRTE